MPESESEEFVQKLNALLKERDRARRAIFDLHMAVSKAEEMRGKAVESAHAAGGKILELQTELSETKTELGASVRTLKESDALLGEAVIRAEAAEKRAIALQGVVERVREEISKAEKPEITEEQLEASRESVEHRWSAALKSFDELDKDENYDDCDWGDVRGDADEERGVLARKARLPAKLIFTIVKATAIPWAVLVGLIAVPEHGVLFTLISLIWLPFAFLIVYRDTGGRRRAVVKKLSVVPVAVPMVKPIVKESAAAIVEHAALEAEADDTGELDALTQDDVEAIFGDPDEEGQDGEGTA